MSGKGFRVVFDISLVVRSPFLFRGLAGQLFGVDAAALRDHAGRPIIPSDQIRGVMRDALLDLADAGALITEQEVSDLFGVRSDREDELDTTNEPKRGRIIFSDLTALGLTSGEVARETTRVQIDDSTGAADEGSLQILELVAPFGQDVPFTGEIVAFCSGDDVVIIAAQLEKSLNAALRSVAAIGGIKSSGFGELVADSEVVPDRTTVTQRLGSITSLEIASPSSENTSTKRRYRVTFDRPILVDATKIADNAFLGAIVVPGAVFKGALARRLELADEDIAGGQLSEALKDLRISHAFPEAKTLGLSAGRAMPLSLVGAKTKNGLKFADALGLTEGQGAKIDGATAYFQPDWKLTWYGAAASALGEQEYDEPQTLARTHTAIENGLAAGKQLFTTIAQSVHQPDGKPKSWIVELEAGDKTPEALALKLFATFEQGLDNIGKTSASASFECINEQSRAPMPVFGSKDTFALVLETPAFLIDAGVAAPVSPREAYTRYFQEVLPGAELVDFYARQNFAGGYISRRRASYAHYYPFLLTEPGSVFLLKTTDTKSLNKLITTGLPVPARSDPHTPFTWKNCPYVPENGYGRFSADYLSTKSSLIGAAEYA